MALLRRAVLLLVAASASHLAAGCGSSAPPTSAGPANDKMTIPKGMPGAGPAAQKQQPKSPR